MKTKTYHSFSEYFEGEFNSKPLTGRTNDKQKLDSQREKFVGVCPFCKQPARFIVGTNVLVCSNDNCKGKQITVTNTDGTETVKYIPYSRLLSERGMDIGNTLFDD